MKVSITCPSKDGLNLQDKKSCSSTSKHIHVDINAAAYTKVDQAISFSSNTFPIRKQKNMENLFI